jgi:hypothetical protein
MAAIQIIQDTEQLKNEINEGVKVQLQEFLKHFTPKQPNEYLTRSDVAKMFDVDISTMGISVGPCHPFRLKWCHFERYYNNTKSLFSLKICFSHRLTC